MCQTILCVKQWIGTKFILSCNWRSTEVVGIRYVIEVQVQGFLGQVCYPLSVSTGTFRNVKVNRLLWDNMHINSIRAKADIVCMVNKDNDAQKQRELDVPWARESNTQPPPERCPLPCLLHFALYYYAKEIYKHQLVTRRMVWYW